MLNRVSGGIATMAACGMVAICYARPHDRAEFRSGVEMVALAVTVQDGHGDFRQGLSAEHFRVFENGLERPIALFAAGEVPIDLGLLMDTSASMASKIGSAQHAADILIRSLADRDRAALWCFGGRIREV